MLIVAIDTSGRKGSIALCREDANSFEVLQLTSLEGGSYAAQLMPHISDTLRQHNVSKSQVDGFVAVSGPGSFTGLRVGLATVKGLCEVLNKPLATVSMLQALALTYGTRDSESPSTCSVTALLDAGRGELYVGEYQITSARAALLDEKIAKVPEFAVEAEGITRYVLTPEPAIEAALQAVNIPVRLVDPLAADQIARIGLVKLLASEFADTSSIDVNYIRRSDAELLATPKR